MVRQAAGGARPEDRGRLAEGHAGHGPCHHRRVPARGGLRPADCALRILADQGCGRRVVPDAGRPLVQAHLGHHRRRIRRVQPHGVGSEDRGHRHHRRRAAVDLRRRAARPHLRIFRRMGRPRAGRDRRRHLLVPVAAARHPDGHHDLRRPVRPVERHPGIRHLHHRGVHPAVLPHHPRRSGAHQRVGLRRVGEGRGRLHMAHHDQALNEMRPYLCSLNENDKNTILTFMKMMKQYMPVYTFPCQCGTNQNSCCLAAEDKRIEEKCLN